MSTEPSTEYLDAEQIIRVEALAHAAALLPSKLTINAPAIEVAAALTLVAEWITEGPTTESEATR